jgi:hypothetical protein
MESATSTHPFNNWKGLQTVQQGQKQASLNSRHWGVLSGALYKLCGTCKTGQGDMSAKHTMGDELRWMWGKGTWWPESETWSQKFNLNFPQGSCTCSLLHLWTFSFWTWVYAKLRCTCGQSPIWVRFKFLRVNLGTINFKLWLYHKLTCGFYHTF